MSERVGSAAAPGAYAPAGAATSGTGASSAPRALQLDPADNVAVAVAALRGGESVPVGAVEITLREDVRTGHKLALRAIREGDAIVKYGEIIGRASTDIAAGSWVHVHNVVSARLPGPGSA